METITEFIENLSITDIDLVDKLANLYDAGQISDKVYEVASEYESFRNIEDYIMEMLQDEIGNSKLTKQYIGFIEKETQVLYEDSHIDYMNFTGGLYNCDDIYLYAIADVLDLDMDKLEDYEESEEE